MKASITIPFTLFKGVFLVFLPLMIGLACQAPPEPTEAELTELVKQLNQKMEQAYNSGALDKVAAFYMDDAYLLGPRGYQQQGRKAIDDYWIRIKNPIRWKLDVIKVSKNEADLYETDYWKNLKEKPPHWNTTELQIDPAKTVLYQLGHSQLEYEREDATHQISHVDFVLVWQEQEDGSYRILVDTYH